VNNKIKMQKIILNLSFAIAFAGLMLVRSGYDDYWMLILAGIISGFTTSNNLIKTLQVKLDNKE